MVFTTNIDGWDKFTTAATSAKGISIEQMIELARASNVRIEEAYEFIVKHIASHTNVTDTLLVESVEQLKLADPIEHPRIRLFGREVVGDGGQGDVYWDAGATDTADDGIVIARDGVSIGRWKRIHNNTIDPKWYNDFDTCITALGNDEYTVEVNHPVDLQNETVVVPENISLVCKKNCLFSNGTLTINGSFKAGLYQVFDEDLIINGTSKIETIYPEWFAVNTTPGMTNMTMAFQKAAAAALASVGKVEVHDGEYYLDDTIISMDENHALKWEFGNKVTLATHLTGTTPLFSFVGNNRSNGGIFGRPNIIAQNAGTVTARNSGVAVLVEGAKSLKLDYYVKDMTYGLHLHNNEAGTYTEQIYFNIWSEYCQKAIVFEKSAGDPSFHGCSGFLYTDVWAGQTGIDVGSGVYWYNFDLRLDAISHSSVSSDPAILIQSDGQTRKGTAVFNIESQGDGGAGDHQVFDMPGAQSWSAQTYVSMQGADELTGSRRKRNGLNLNDDGYANLKPFLTGKRGYNVPVSDSLSLSDVNGGLILIRNSSSGYTAFVLVDEVRGATIISDPNNIIQIKDICSTYTSSTISFLNTFPSVIEDSNSELSNQGYTIGHKLIISGTINNDKIITVDSITTGAISIKTDNYFTTEAEGNSVTLTYKEGFYVSATNGTLTIKNNYSASKIIDTILIGL